MSAVHRDLTEAVARALEAMGATGVEPVVEPSARPEFGDWSTPAPLRAAKVLRRPPQVIAAELAAQLTEQGVELVAEWTVSPPGYVNARLNDGRWAAQVMSAAMALDAAVPLGGVRSGRTLIEHTNINTNKAAHVGHLRNACLGDSVARILRRTGHTVEVNNYIDDTGVQVADVVLGMRELGVEQGADEPFDQYCSRVYVEVCRRYETEPELLEKRVAILKQVEARSGEVATYVKDLARRVVAAHLATMARFDVHYDLLSWESDILEMGFWERAFTLLKDSGAIVFTETGKTAGCWVMPADDGADDAEDEARADAKVLVKSDGVATYTAKDIAYQLWKFGLLGLDFKFSSWDASAADAPMTTDAAHGAAGDFGHATRVINVIDARQAYPQGVVREALRRLGHTEAADNSVHLAYEVVALSAAAAAELGVEVEEGRERVALSGRRGIEVRADDLLDRAIERVRPKALDEETARRLASGAVRYYLQRFSLNQVITFDFDEALRTTGDTGVYLQYAHARAAGVLRRVPDEGESRTPEPLHPTERALLHAVDGYERALEEAAVGLSPSTLATYAFALASALSDFYEHTPPMVREEDLGVRAFRRALVSATRATLADALVTLGMSAPDRL
jgi:arginyl-tRNA synthetase